MRITVRKFNPVADSGIIEYRSGRTIITTSESELTAEMDKDAFLASYFPDGLWLALNEKSVIGAILVTSEEHNDNETVLISGLRIDRTYRRQGLGGLLMHKADLYADAKKIGLLTGIIPESNEAALSLFKKCRFTVSESSDGQVLMRKMRRSHDRRP